MKDEYSLKRSSILLINAVASASIRLFDGKITRKEARAEQEKVAKKVVARYGIIVALCSIVPYKRAIFKVSIDGKMQMTRPGEAKGHVDLVKPYTFGIDNYFRSTWPEMWKESIETEKKTRPKVKKSGVKK